MSRRHHHRDRRRRSGGAPARPAQRSSGPDVHAYFSPAFCCGRRSARVDGAYSLTPLRRSCDYACSVVQSVRPTTTAPRRPRDERSVESTTGAVAVGGRGGSRSRRLSPVAGASIPAMAPFPVAAHRTGHANFPHPALGRDHAFAHGRLAVRDPRCVSPYSVHSRSSGKRTHFPDRTFCLRQSHWRSRRVACRSIAA